MGGWVGGWVDLVGWVWVGGFGWVGLGGFTIMSDFRGTLGSGESVEKTEIGNMCNSLRCIPF